MEPIHGPYCTIGPGGVCQSAHCKDCGRPHSMWTVCGCTPVTAETIVLPGAFSEESAKGLVGTDVTMNFDPDNVVGKVVDVEVDDVGLRFTIEVR